MQEKMNTCKQLRYNKRYGSITKTIRNIKNKLDMWSCHPAKKEKMKRYKCRQS